MLNSGSLNRFVRFLPLDDHSAMSDTPQFY